jgi:hypothetical protein
LLSTIQKLDYLTSPEAELGGRACLFTRKQEALAEEFIKNPQENLLKTSLNLGFTSCTNSQ